MRTEFKFKLLESRGKNVIEKVEEVKTTFKCKSCETVNPLEKAIRCKLCNINDASEADDESANEIEGNEDDESANEIEGSEDEAKSEE